MTVYRLGATAVGYDNGATWAARSWETVTSHG